MKTHKFIMICAILFLFISGTAWAENQANVAEDTPAILASLDKTGFVSLDDSAIAEIRGEALYVMGKIWFLNGLDFSPNPQVGWAIGIANIATEWRYGNYGGLGWPDDSIESPLPVVDKMDSYFKEHDETGDDGSLFDHLKNDLKLTQSFWGKIYQPTVYDGPGDPPPVYDGHFSFRVYVSRISVLSTGAKRFFFLWRPMPLTEYARRQVLFVGKLFGGSFPK